MASWTRSIASDIHLRMSLSRCKALFPLSSSWLARSTCMSWAFSPNLTLFTIMVHMRKRGWGMRVCKETWENQFHFRNRLLSDKKKYNEFKLIGSLWQNVSPYVLVKLTSSDLGWGWTKKKVLCFIWYLTVWEKWYNYIYLFVLKHKSLL